MACLNLGVRAFGGGVMLAEVFFGWIGVEDPFPQGGGPMEAAKIELVGGQLESKDGGARARTCSLTRR